jgi:hypothetical protein
MFDLLIGLVVADLALLGWLWTAEGLFRWPVPPAARRALGLVALGLVGLLLGLDLVRTCGPVELFPVPTFDGAGPPGPDNPPPRRRPAHPAHIDINPLDDAPT